METKRLKNSPILIARKTIQNVRPKYYPNVVSFSSKTPKLKKPKDA